MSRIHDLLKNFGTIIKNYGTIIIAIFGCLLFFLLMWMCFSQMHQFGKTATRNVSNGVIPETIHITLPSSSDSMTIAKIGSEITLFNAKMDSAILLINTWNMRCDEHERLQHGLNDLRQETNNVIDKQNGWLSFWIGILAIVGALIPFIFQMMGKQKIDSELETVKTQVASELQEVKKQRKEMESTKFVSKISEITFTLMECSESIWHIDDYDRNDYCQELLNKLSETTSSFFETINKNKTLDPYHESLKMVLLQLLAAYNACKPLSIFKHRLKQLDKLTNDIGAILHDFHKKSFIEYELNNVLRQMKEIRI